MSSAYDAIIIGAGPAGSSAAIRLAKAGWRTALVEKQQFPRRKVCGECIAASNFPLLDELGIGPAVARLAGPALRRVALMHAHDTVESPLPPYAGGADSRYAWGKALGREHLDSLLLERAAQCGVHVLQPWMARSVRQETGMSICDVMEVDSKRHLTLEAPVIIAAHGSWERMPTGNAEPERDSRPSDLFAFKANFLTTAMEPGLLPVLAFPGGYGGMVLADHGTVTLACCLRRDTLHGCRERFGGRKAAESIQAYLMQSCQGVRERLSGATLASPWLSVGPIRPGVRINRHRDAIFRLGNAAGEAHPIIGEGMSMALQSAAVLASVLATGRSQAADSAFLAQARSRYTAAWMNAFAPRIRLAAIFAHIAMRPLAARGAMALLRRHPGILTGAARWSGKVTCAPLA